MAHGNSVLRSLLWPSLVAVALASFYVITQPGPADYNDAYDYDHLAKSILQGRYELSDDYKSPPLPTMQREPGYPAFRAAVYAIAGDRPDVILWIQALLAGATVLLAGSALRRVDPRSALPAAWLIALYPGFAAWTGQHYSEIFAAFLVLIAAYAWVRLWEASDEKSRASKLAVLFGLLIGVLSLTKAAFQVLPIFAAGLLIAAASWRARWKQAFLIIVGFLIVVTPWIVRNGLTFGQYVITYRSGIILYMRAIEAEASWSELATSYGSVMLGNATMLRLFPEKPPIIGQLWKKIWEIKLAHLREGLRAYESDAILLSQARQKIFSSPSVFARFALWSGIDELRLFGLSSPLSPKFSVELIANQEAKEGRLTWAKLGVVLGAHALQFLWWTLIIAGFVVLVRARVWQHPSLLFVGYTAVMHAPFDNITRYAVPVLPWIMALVAAAIIRPRISHEAAGQPRILVLAESLDPSSGWGAYARGLVEPLRKNGAELAVLTSDSTGESLPRPLSSRALRRSLSRAEPRDSGRARAEGRGGPRLPGILDSRIAWFLAGLRLRRWLATQKFDVIYAMVEPYARLYRIFGRTPFVVTVHGTYADPAAHGRFSSDFREALERACKIVAVSDYTRERVPAEFLGKTAVIPNGVDLDIVNEPFVPAPDHGSPLILSVGAIKARKGFDRLIAGFAEFARTRPRAELVILGRDLDSSVRQRLVSQIASLGLASRVRLQGEVPRAALLGWYRACDVFALTPVLDGGFEGFGLVYLEANVFGKPCVGSRDSGARDAILEGENGCLADADDSRDVARALECALALSPERVRASLAGRTWDESAGNYMRVLDSCNG